MAGGEEGMVGVTAESLRWSWRVEIPPVPREYITGKIREYALQVGGLDGSLPPDLTTSQDATGKDGSKRVPPDQGSRRDRRAGRRAGRSHPENSVAPITHPGYWFLGNHRKPKPPFDDLVVDLTHIVAHRGLVYLHFHGGCVD